MIIHNYDNITKEYLHSSKANLDELETLKQGTYIYLIPNNATNINPLPNKEGFAVCFNEEANCWAYQEDHRGEIVYNREDLSPIQVDYIGPIKDGFLLVLPKPKNKYQIWQNGEYQYPDIQTLKLTVKEDLDDAYELKIQATYRVGQYYVQPTWATIYTNTLVAMQEDLKPDNKLDQIYRILLITNPKIGSFYHLQVDSIDEFMPYYTKVKDTYKKLTEEYHDKIVKLSESMDPETIVSLILTY